MDIVEIFRNACGGAWAIVLICIVVGILLAILIVKVLGKLYKKIGWEEGSKKRVIVQHILVTVLFVIMYVLGRHISAIAFSVVYVLVMILTHFRDNTSSKNLENLFQVLAIVVYIVGCIVALADIVNGVSSSYCGC